MSKVDDFLRACKDNVGKWTCSLHTTGSNQPAAIFREAKKLGYEFEETKPQRWAEQKYCPICKQTTTHYTLLKIEPTSTVHSRYNINSKTRERILKIFENKDAFTGASISSKPEIAHKTPWTRLEHDIDASNLSDEEIKQHFQLLTRDHNLLKDRRCDYCKKHNIRPPFLEIPFWYEGDSQYTGSCEGCGWYDGKKWREELSKKLK